jgi:hypothetical protein
MLRILVFGLFALLLGGCAAPTEFSNPLTSTEDLKADESIIGNWYVAKEGEVTMIHIARDIESGNLDIVASEYWSSGPEGFRLGWLRAMGQLVTLNDATYLSLRRIAGEGFDYTAEGQTPGYIIVKVLVDAEQPDYLRFAFAAYCGYETGKDITVSILTGVCPEGQVYGDPNYEFVELSAEDLRHMIAEGKGAVRFNCPLVFRRLEHWPKDE